MDWSNRTRAWLMRSSPRNWNGLVIGGRGGGLWGAQMGEQPLGLNAFCSVGPHPGPLPKGGGAMADVGGMNFFENRNDADARGARDWRPMAEGTSLGTMAVVESTPERLVLKGAGRYSLFL